MKRFIALVLSLVMALSLCVPAWGAEPVTHEVADKTTFTNALNAAAAGDIIKLTASIDMGADYARVAKKLTFDLGAFTITSDGASYGTVYVSTAGDLTINATTGGITNTAGNAIGNYGVVVVNGGTFTGDYALYNFYYDATTFGTATINGGTFQANSGNLAIANCGKLTVAGGDIETLDSTAELKVTAGTIDTLIVKDPDYNPPVTSTTISGGTVDSIEVVDDPAGTMTEEEVKETISITGGTFDVEPDEKFLADHYHLYVNENGDYTALKSFIVTFHSNFGNSISIDDYCPVGDTLTLPTDLFQAPEGMQFAGWATSATGAVISDTTYGGPEDTTFYAIWEKEECTGDSHVEIVVEYSDEVATKVYCDYCKVNFAFVQGTEDDAKDKFGEGNYVNAEKDVWYTLKAQSGEVPSVPEVPPVEDEETLVKVEATVSGSTATIETVEGLDKIASEEVKTDSVTLDFSEEGTADTPVSTVVIPTNVVDEIEEVLSDTTNKVDSLEIVTDDATVTFDAAAIAAINKNAEDANASSVSLTVDVQPVSTATDVSTENREAFEAVMKKDGSENAMLLSIEFVGGNEEIFSDGKAAGTATVKVKLADGLKSATLFYLKSDGAVKLGSYNADAEGYITVTLDHFSEYVLLGSIKTVSSGWSGYYPVVGGTTTTPDADETVTSPKNFDAGIALYVGMSVAAAVGTVTLGKKRED